MLSNFKFFRASLVPDMVKSFGSGSTTLAKKFRKAYWSTENLLWLLCVGIAHAMALGLGPWLAVEIPELVEKGVITYKEKVAA
jgi:hypothetical protein